RSIPIVVEDAATILRANDDQCAVADAIQAHGIVNTLPPVQETDTGDSPLRADAASESDLTSIHSDLSGEFIGTFAGGELHVRVGAFGATDRVVVEAYGPELGVDLG